MKKFMIALLSTTFLVIVISVGFSTVKVDASVEEEPVVVKEAIIEEVIEEEINEDKPVKWDTVRNNETDIKLFMQNGITTEDIMQKVREIKEEHLQDSPVDIESIQDQIPNMKIAGARFRIGDTTSENYPYDATRVGMPVGAEIEYAEGSLLDADTIPWHQFEGQMVKIQLEGSKVFMAEFYTIEQVEFIINLEY